jgi:predicted NACHT family NTPase
VSAPGGHGRSRSPYCTALPDEVADCLPVYVRIGLYAQHLKDHPDATIAEFAPKQNYQLPLTEELLRREMERGKALFLLDGLDEIVDTAQRQDLARRVNEFALNNPGCPIIVTSRIVGYSAASLSSSFEEFTVRPFDDEEIESFIRHWYQTLGEAERAEDLIESLKRNDSVRRLATNPLLLTVTALIHRRKTKLPNRRVELYEDAAKTLADSWMSERRLTPDDWDADEALDDLLPAIAFIPESCQAWEHWLRTSRGCAASRVRFRRGD